ncbi:hypothetical protein [Reichenbachiella ulvae]|uniref:Sugar lactone lactonase YvrE n=1 Tax=Reichenbachiella ulvae TaxID=2980104 RepID=A0ABT3CNG9_9BACT|nr:hypothetical protein [Reichenbachiella ulvae]MCV9385278.1 hypothetical protein [Reichenbachiella ulvae]
MTISTLKLLCFLALAYGNIQIVSAQLSEGTLVYDAPDQVVWHAASQTWFVSSLGGGISLEKDGYGWISRLDREGQVIAPYWIGKDEGMHAPSGMTLTENYLFVCDRDGVYQVDIEKSQIHAFFEIPDGEFVNDVAMGPDGELYVSDFFANRIYRIQPESKKVEVWLETDNLLSPDGLMIDQDQLIVACWGRLSEPGTFETSKLGDLLSIDLKSKKIRTLAQDVGNLEGITKIGNDFYITDWAAGKLLKVKPKSAEVQTILSGLEHPTDPWYAENLDVLAFPQHGTNQVLFLNMNSNLSEK